MRTIIPFLLGAMASSPAFAQDIAGTYPVASLQRSHAPSGNASPGERLSDEVEETLVLFEFEQHDRMTLPVRMGERSDLDFMVDTGAERSAISSELANELALSETGIKTVISFAGTTQVPSVRAPSIGFGEDDWRSMEMLTFKRRAIGADGVLGIDSLQNKIVTFDFEDEEMRIRPSPNGKKRAGSREVAVDLVEREGRLVISNARISGLQVDIIIDTGSAVSVGNMALRDRLRREGKLSDLQEGVMLTFTGQLVPAEVGVVRNVDVDGFTVSRMAVAFVRSQSFDYLGYVDEPVLYLGMEAMRAFRQLEIDFANKRALFKARDVPGFNSRSNWFIEQEQKRHREKTLERLSSPPVPGS